MEKTTEKAVETKNLKETGKDIDKESEKEIVNEMQKESLDSATAMGMELLMLRPEELITNDNNTFSVEQDFVELSSSISKFGLRQPLDVVPDKSGKYRIVGGERRFRSICKCMEEGQNLYPYGIPCVVNNRRPGSTLEEKIMIYEENMHNRDMRTTYLEKLKELYYMYEEMQAQDPTFPKNIVKRLSEKLGVGLRQTYKLKDIAMCEDVWIRQAVDQNMLPIDRATAVLRFPKEARDELHKFFEENGKITADILSEFKEKYFPQKESRNAQAKEDASLPAEDYSALTDVSNSLAAKDVKTPAAVEEQSFEENHMDAASYAGYDGSAQKTVPVEVPKHTSIHHNAAVDVQNITAESVEDQEISEAFGGDIAKINLKNYEDPEEYEEDYNEEEQMYGESSSYIPKPYQEKEKNKENVKMPLVNMDLDEQEMSNALYWFKSMSKKGFMTEEEEMYVDAMVKSLLKFYFPSFVKKGRIRDEMKETIEEMVLMMQPLLS